MIDLHAHILPGLDDGPRTLEDAAALARVAVAGGTRVLAATSHVNRSFGLDAEDLARAREIVIERLVREEIPLEVVQGGEISPGRLPEFDDAELQALTLGGGPWLLLECPFSPAATAMELMVSDLQRRGFGVLLAHPERSPSFQREPALLARMTSRGALAQVTAGSVVGDFGEVARRSALRLVQDGLVHVLASDAHHHVHRPPGLAGAMHVLRESFGDVTDLVEWMTDSLPAAMLAGARLPERPPLPRPRGLHRLRSRLRA